MINQTIKIHQSVFEGFKKAEYDTFDSNLNLSKLVIPFSKLCKSYKPEDIYSGIEKIPYDERDPDFKLILKHEFQTC